jgi:hypothetical protein
LYDQPEIHRPRQSGVEVLPDPCKDVVHAVPVSDRYFFKDAAGQAVAYRIGIRPTIDYKPATRPRITRWQLLAAANRTVGYTVTGYVSSLVAQQPGHAIAIGLKTGLAIGVVTAIATTCTPLIEWTADHVPEKRMGVFGVGLILIGFTLQSVQYWLALLDVSVR